MRIKAALFCTLGLMTAFGAVACKNPKIKGSRGRTVKANVSTFDPNGDIGVDLDKYGSERPDDYAVQQAFHGAFEPMDECVLEAKKRKGMGTAAVLEGDLAVAVRLDPAIGTKPAAVNATLPKRYAKDDDLAQCLRNAVGGVTFPQYDGPPVVVDLSCELDAGSEYEEDW